MLKDPYNFDFLTLSQDAREKDLEVGLVEDIRKFLELGVGFSFVGSKYPLEIAGEDYRLDLLFHHLKLRCFIVIDLKTGAFKPEYTGKMNFYLAAVDDTLKHPTDQPSISLILCPTKKQLVVEYTLPGTTTPMGSFEFIHLANLPKEFKGSLPTIEELEAESIHFPVMPLPETRNRFKGKFTQRPGSKSHTGLASPKVKLRRLYRPQLKSLA